LWIKRVILGRVLISYPSLFITRSLNLLQETFELNPTIFTKSLQPASHRHLAYPITSAKKPSEVEWNYINE